MENNLYRVRLAVAYVDKDGVFRAPPEEVDMTKELLDKHNELADMFNLPRHDVLDDPEARRARAEDEANGDGSDADMPPPAPQNPEQAEQPKARGRGRSKSKDDSDEL